MTIKKITKRGVISVGHKCNSNCRFCYMHHQNNKCFKKIDKLLLEADRRRYFYQDGWVDIWGGEPTIYPDILRLVSYCDNIGLKPTVITNGLKLDKRKEVQKYKDVGVNDFLISVNGLKSNADYIMQVPNAHKKVDKAINNFNSVEVPFRINTSLHKYVMKELPSIARYAVKKEANVFNMIMFNPYFEWEYKKDIPFQVRYSTLAPYIKKAIKICESSGVEVNVRYFPFCLLKGFEKNVYNYMQIHYDIYEWNHCSEHTSLFPSMPEKWYNTEAIRIREKDLRYKKNLNCACCGLNYICDGFHNQYVKRFGFGEELTYLDWNLWNTPNHFINNQKRKRLLYTKPSISSFEYLLRDKKLMFELVKNYLGRVKNGVI